MSIAVELVPRVRRAQAEEAAIERASSSQRSIFHLGVVRLHRPADRAAQAEHANAQIRMPRNAVTFAERSSGSRHHFAGRHHVFFFEERKCERGTTRHA
jgi:hypothetical protein